MGAETQPAAPDLVDAPGLPEDPAERRAELDRLIATDEAEMKSNISGWMRNQQARDDHRTLLEMKGEAASGPLDFYDTASVDDVRGALGKIDGAIAEMEALMKANMRGYHAKENAEARALYRNLIEARERAGRRLK